MEAKDYLTAYYNQYDEDGRLRSRHGTVEYLTTMRYVEKYLKPGMRVIEIGAATGRYSHTLAQKGCRVDAVELIEHNIEIFKANTLPNEPVTITQGNAVDLSDFEADTYDITLLLGPMYHLYTKEEQLKALSEAIRITKKGGVIFAAYCNNDATMVQYCFQREMIKDEYYRAKMNPVNFKLSSDPSELFELYRKEDINELMKGFKVTRLHYIGTDMATNFMREAIDSMDDELFDLYLQYHFYICERPDMVGATHHMLDVFRKD